MPKLIKSLSKKMSRIYTMSDDLLLQWSNSLIGYLKKDLPEFIAFDEDLDPAYLELKAAFDEAIKEGGDEVGVARLGDKTETINSRIHKAHKTYRRLRYFVKKAFENKLAIQRQFGIGRFTKVRNSQPKLISFFDDLAVSVAQYRDELLAAKTPESLLAEVSATGPELRRANQEQENAKGSRTVDTEARITLFNKLFTKTTQFEAAADLVYEDKPAQAARYDRPGSRGMSGEEDEGRGTE